ncbi:Protein of unknown function [Streptomyces sp. 2224.1]|uniref:DUF4231 domain-containing protein n=1 Tax=Streptomyces sp. 2224.1 TaxID=1881020 RepID=UPI00089C0609|nr:DUF4231 domain-containing protein [Streptomyces sp. 2224.1]SEB49661.1 Protein of unknown function [Streptomyces sp. 2224.1]
MTGPGSGSFTWHQLPPFFRDADTGSIRSKRRYFGQLRLTLLLLFLAAAVGTTTLKFSSNGTDWAGLAASLAFISSILVRLYIVEQRDERRWYECRAAAESCKTLAWRYAVCGEPFPESMPAVEARRLFINRLREISLGLDIVDVSAGLDVNEAMERCRAAGRDERIATYKSNRLMEQVEWYARMAKLRDKQSRTWRSVALAGEMIGVVAGAVKAYGVVSIDLLGVVSAGVAGITAWFQAQRLETEASAYSLTAREIRHILSLTDESADAESWGKFVDQAEAAISREHTMWASGRTGNVGLTG